MPWGHEPAPPDAMPAAGSSRADLWEEFGRLFSHYGLWKHIRHAHEDGHVDIGEVDWDRILDILAELGLRGGE